MLGFFADIKILYRTMIAHYARPDFAARTLIGKIRLSVGVLTGRRNGRLGHGITKNEKLNCGQVQVN